MSDKSVKKYLKAKHGDEFEKQSTRAEYEELRRMKENCVYSDSPRDLIEVKIMQAMSEGAFENLEGKGKPLRDDEYFEAPDHLRVGYHLLKNAGFLPEEVRLSKEIESLKERLETAKTDEEKNEIQKKIVKATMDFGFYMDYNRKFAKMLY
jgi:hypothetical protein